jgi:hypothetical protein
MVRHKLWSGILLGLGGLSIGAWYTLPPVHSAQAISPSWAIAKAPEFIRPPQTCPNDLETLVSLLLRDLPSYANRVTQRSFHLDQLSDRPGVVIIAGQPDYAPLTLGPGAYTPSDSTDEPRQVFFTTLERQYVSDTSISLQTYHWLFLTQSQDRWRLVLLFSSTGDYPAERPPSPPEDTSQGAIAQAIRLWLRDCAAGAVES